MKRKDFDTIQEYIDYLIYKKNILSTKSIFILIIIIGAIAIASLQLSKSSNSDFDWFEGNTITNEFMKDTLLQVGYSQDEIDKLTDEQLYSLFDRAFDNIKGQQVGNYKYQEYPEQNAGILKQDYYLKASKGDFDFIVTDFEDKKLKYSFSKLYNKDLITIYNDAYYLKMIINDNSTDSFKIQQILSNIKDPQMLLYGTLLTKEKYRRDTIIDKMSLSPILLKKQVNVTSRFSTSMGSISTLTNDKKDIRFDEMAQYLKEGSYIFYRLEFYIDNNLLTAYIYKNTNDFKLSFYGIYSKHESDIYLTVYDFIQMENKTTQNNTTNNTINNTNTNFTEESTIDENTHSFTGNETQDSMDEIVSNTEDMSNNEAQEEYEELNLD